MDFLTKAAFYIMYGISILIVLFFFGCTFFAGKNSSTPIAEPIIFAIAGILTGIGLYLVHQAIQNSHNYINGCMMLGQVWLAVLVFVIFCFWIFVPMMWR